MLGWVVVALAYQDNQCCLCRFLKLMWRPSSKQDVARSNGPLSGKISRCFSVNNWLNLIHAGFSTEAFGWSCSFNAYCFCWICFGKLLFELHRRNPIIVSIIYFLALTNLQSGCFYFCQILFHGARSVYGLWRFFWGPNNKLNP